MRTPRGIFLCLGLSLVGAVLAGYLGSLHLALQRGALLGGALCGTVGTSWNCHAVAASRLGQGLGLPLAFWGVLGYLAALALAGIAWQVPDWRPRALAALAGLAFLFIVCDAALLAVMVGSLRTLCLLCLATYLVNGLLLVGAWSAAGRPWRALVGDIPAAWRALRPGPSAAVAWAFWGIVATGAAGLAAVQGVARTFVEPPAVLEAKIREHVRQAPRVSVDVEGSPRRGPADAPVRIVQFTDFLCPLCQTASQYNAVILAAHPGEVSLVAKQFPLEQSCNSAIPRTVHAGSCQLATAALCAHRQGRFWPFYARLVRAGPAYPLGDLEADAARVGLDAAAFRQCLADGTGAAAVARDVAEGGRLGLVGTPVLVINGVLIQGTVTPAQFEVLRTVLREEQKTP